MSALAPEGYDEPHVGQFWVDSVAKLPPSGWVVRYSSQVSTRDMRFMGARAAALDDARVEGVR